MPGRVPCGLLLITIILLTSLDAHVTAVIPISLVRKLRHQEVMGPS